MLRPRKTPQRLVETEPLQRCRLNGKSFPQILCRNEDLRIGETALYVALNGITYSGTITGLGDVDGMLAVQFEGGLKPLKLGESPDMAEEI